VHKKSFGLGKCDVLMPCPAEVVMIFHIIVNPGWPSLSCQILKDSGFLNMVGIATYS